MSSKRGRPRKNGGQPGWMLVRGLEILFPYDQSRRAGEKHSVALREAVTAVKAEQTRATAGARPRSTRSASFSA